MNCRQVLRKGMIWEVGTGDEISLWYDNWIDTQCLIEIMELDDTSNLDQLLRFANLSRIISGISKN